MSVIETEELTKRFGSLEAVRELNLRVAKGQITGFLGLNGAGKSTTIKNAAWNDPPHLWHWNRAWQAH